MNLKVKLQLTLPILLTGFFITACSSATSESSRIPSTVQAEQLSAQTVEQTETTAGAAQMKIDGALGNVAEGLNINAGHIDDISVIEYFDTTVNPDKKPIIICEHGLSGSKADYQAIAEVFAKSGYYVLTPDAYQHGDRTEGDELTVVEAAVVTAGEIDKLLDYCRQLPDVDINRIGMIGFSMGGMVCYYYIANGSYQIDAACIVCSTPDWEELIGNSVAYSKYVHGETRKVLTPWGKNAVNKFIRKHSPKASLLSKSTGTDYLIISGKEDNLMPFTGSVDFYTKMKNNGEDVSILLEEGHGHETTAEDALNIGKFIMEKFVLE